jgi:hypothetical protein
LTIAATKNQEILFGKKAVAKCEKSVPSHLFCEVEAYDVPGICGHGFECVLMKAGEKQTVCGVEYTCLDLASLKSRQ